MKRKHYKFSLVSKHQLYYNLLTYNVSSSLGDISVFDSVVSLTPPDNFNGEIEVNVTVTDGELFDTGSFLVNVLVCKNLV